MLNQHKTLLSGNVSEALTEIIKKNVQKLGAFTLPELAKEVMLEYGNLYPILLLEAHEVIRAFNVLYLPDAYDVELSPDEGGDCKIVMKSVYAAIRTFMQNNQTTPIRAIDIGNHVVAALGAVGDAKALGNVIKILSEQASSLNLVKSYRFNASGALDDTESTLLNVIATYSPIKVTELSKHFQHITPDKLDAILLSLTTTGFINIVSSCENNIVSFIPNDERDLFSIIYTGNQNPMLKTDKKQSNQAILTVLSRIIASAPTLTLHALIATYNREMNLPADAENDAYVAELFKGNLDALMVTSSHHFNGMFSEEPNGALKEEILNLVSNYPDPKGLGKAFFENHFNRNVRLGATDELNEAVTQLTVDGFINVIGGDNGGYNLTYLTTNPLHQNSILYMGQSMVQQHNPVPGWNNLNHLQQVDLSQGFAPSQAGARYGMGFQEPQTLNSTSLFHFTFNVKGVELTFEQLRDLHEELTNLAANRQFYDAKPSLINTKLFVGDVEVTEQEQSELLVTLEPLFPNIFFQPPGAFMLGNGLRRYCENGPESISRRHF